MTIQDKLNNSTLGKLFMQVTYYYHALINKTTMNKIVIIPLIGLLFVFSTHSAFAHSYGAISPASIPAIYLNTNQRPMTIAQPPNTLSQKAKIHLGKQLFEDTNLSKSGEMACSTCHQASMGFSDGRDFSLDNQGTPLPYNTPSIQYVAFNYYFGWTARFPHLQEHLDALMTNPKLMDRNWPELSQKIKQNDIYVQLFNNAGYDEISRTTISDAIIQYEYSLAKPSRYDLYILGDKQQFSEKENLGYSLFKEFGCGSCHQGKNLGGNLRQKFGVMKSYFNEHTKIEERDLGYYTTTLKDEDRFYFRVPSLRNVTNTAPYFHDGSAKTLAMAIEIMFVYQLGIKPSDTDINLIESFLHTLEPVE